ncbi:alpha/beta hydrolase family protein [Dyadobacter sp. BHUBP1]|uniref:alpha/beta hydrolase family protein n=1 Tax=Dyadobacter sp. BHUBP1 TaxID=3424178 RepID=UPI003D3589D3
MLLLFPDEAADHIMRDLRHSEQRYDQCDRGRVEERRHGATDMIIPVAQARTMYAHLQELKVPSDLITLPNGGHVGEGTRPKWPGTCREGL